MKNDGFTLVELLAVIAILAVLVIIAMPSVIDIFNQAKKETFISNVKVIYQQSESKYISESFKGNKLVEISSYDDTKLNLSDEELVYCLNLNVRGEITSMTVGNNSYHIVYNSIDDITDINIYDIIEGALPAGSCGDPSFVPEKSLYKVLASEAEKDNPLVMKYPGNHNDSYNNSGRYDVYFFHAEIDNYDKAANVAEKNNVIFANKCWKIIRTTDTGGVKLMYNGNVKSQPEGYCSNYGDEQQLPVNVSFNDRWESPAYMGYKYGMPYEYEVISNSRLNSNWQERYLFANDFKYENGQYTLIDPVEGSGNDSRHYFCLTPGVSTCSEIGYGYHRSYNFLYYIIMRDGLKIDVALNNMLSNNTHDSTMKIFLENWYATNLNSFSKKIDDVIYCNDRNIIDIGGWDANGGILGDYLSFTNNEYSTDIYCSREEDRFSVKNNKAKLNYPIGLPTAQEINLAENGDINATGLEYWVMSPNIHIQEYAIGKYVYANGFTTNFYRARDTGVDYEYGVRPVIALKANVAYSIGDGSTSNPYVIE